MKIACKKKNDFLFNILAFLCQGMFYSKSSYELKNYYKERRFSFKYTRK